MTLFDLPFWLQCIILLGSQLLLVSFKVIHIQLISNLNAPLIKNIIVAVILQVVWLISSAIGIKSVMEGNYILSGFYVLGGILGGIIPLLKQNRRFL